MFVWMLSAASLPALAGPLALQVVDVEGQGHVGDFLAIEGRPEPVVDYLGRWYAILAEERVRVANGGTTRVDLGGSTGFPPNSREVVTDLTMGPVGEAGRVVRSALCRPPALGRDVPCDHEVNRVLALPDALLIAGRLTPSVGQTQPVAWLASSTAGGALTEVSVEAVAVGRNPQVFDLVEGRSGLLVLGSSERGGAMWGMAWWVVYHPEDGTLGAPVYEPSLSYPSEETWRVALPRAGGGWKLALPDGLGRVELVEIGPDGRIEARKPVQGVSIAPRSFGRLFEIGPALWLVSGRQSVGTEETLHAWRIEAGRAVEEATASLPAGLWAHATHSQGGVLLLGGARSAAGSGRSTPTVVTVPLAGR